MALRIAALLLVLMAVPARADAPPDPFEAVNRRVHDFNGFLRRTVLGPAAALYVDYTPQPVRAGLARALVNLGEPLTAVNALLAGEVDIAANAVTRFGINLTLGYGGVRDVEAERGHAPRPFSLGDAACRWGVPSGPYLVLPVLGPSSLRDATAQLATGLALSQAVGSETVTAWASGLGFTDFAEARRDIDQAEAFSLDPYALHRSVWSQRRAATCPDG
jgi:phospholipid-binding lipoprotein MlaA